MVRLLTITVPKPKIEEVLNLVLQLYHDELIFQPQVNGQSSLNLPLEATPPLPPSVSSFGSHSVDDVRTNNKDTEIEHDQFMSVANRPPPSVSSTQHNAFALSSGSLNSKTTSSTYNANESQLISMTLSTSIIYTITLKTKDKALQDVLLAFDKIGVGRQYGQIDVVSLVLSKPAIGALSFAPVNTTTATFTDTATDVVSPMTSGDGGMPPPVGTPSSTSTRLKNNSIDSTTSNSVDTANSQLPPLSLSFVRSSKHIASSSKDEASSRGRKYRVSDRMTIEEIGSFIDDGNHLTFNYLALLACASTIAGAGLLGNSATTVIASMLVSPLMGPILSITFGLAVRHTPTIKKGIRNEVIGILLSFVTGLCIGVGGAFAYPASYRSGEMVGRGTASNLIYGFIVAFASGIAVVLGITMGGVNAIVGTAISASLLPPIVNSGMCMAMALLYNIKQNPGDPDISKDVQDYYVYSGISFSLFAVNFIVIVIVGYCTFRFIKNVRPLDGVSKRNDNDNVIELV